MCAFTFLRKFPLNSLRAIYRTYSSATDAPVKYTSSKANTWKAEYSRSGSPGKDEAAWFQPYVVMASFAAVLVYFCILREENDIDEILGGSLYNKIDGLEEVQLKVALRYNVDNSIDTRAIVARLKEIEEEKKKK